ncbi:MAG TPA: hypothetical protein VKE53_11925 [Pseudolabrys sp.]|jgi:hypothetical protein|nr:hypothetical protein [Pseudolabrys sp.]
MARSWDRRASGGLLRVSRSTWLLATICTLVLAGCNRDNQAVSIAQPRGASVAFDSLDGLPPGQFRKLVQNLNDEAQTRRLAVISREQSSAYRVRGYLAVKVTKHQTTVSWVWDVFDQDEHRALRISGEETANVRYRDAWAAADDAMLSRIAHNSMERLATFLTSPEVAPPGASPPVGEPYVAMAVSQEFSAEAAGIFRVIQPLADPIQAATTETVTDDATDPPPLTLRRPTPSAAQSEPETLTIAASSR